MALSRVDKASSIAPTNLDIAVPLTASDGSYTFDNDCEVLIINTQNGAQNIKIDGEDITAESISSANFRYTSSATYKYTGHISAGSVLTMSTGSFAAQLYLLTTN